MCTWWCIDSRHFSGQPPVAYHLPPEPLTWSGVSTSMLLTWPVRKWLCPIQTKYLKFRNKDLGGAGLSKACQTRVLFLYPPVFLTWLAICSSCICLNFVNKYNKLRLSKKSFRNEWDWHLKICFELEPIFLKKIKLLRLQFCFKLSYSIENGKFIFQITYSNKMHMTNSIIDMCPLTLLRTISLSGCDLRWEDLFIQTV